MLSIYGAPTFNALKVVLIAEEAGLDYQYIELDMLAGEHKSPEHMDRHVLGKVPAIMHDDKPLFESAAICRYLAKIAKSDLYPSDIYQAGIVDQWLDLMASHIGRWLSVFYFNEYIKPLFFKEQPDMAEIEEANNFLEEQLPAIEKQLTDHTFLAGDDLSIADFFAFAYFQTQEKTSVYLDAYPHIVKWYDTIKARPSVAKANALVKC